MGTEFNKTFNNVSAVGEPHLACVLLLDTSGSMSGEPLRLLEQSVNKFKEQICLDELSTKRVDVCIISFDDEARVIQDFTPISELVPVHLEPGILTNMAQGINLAIDKVRERRKLYSDLGIASFTPWIFMLTDGASTEDLEEVANRIYDEEHAIRADGSKKQKLIFWSCGVPGYCPQDLAKLGPRIIELEGYSFTGIFNWLSESMVIISCSDVDITDSPQLSKLPADANVVDRKQIPFEW